MELNQISCCLDCVHPIDESGQCLIAKMFEKPVKPEHGCSWRVPIKRKAVLTNGDRIRQMTDEELAEWFAPHMRCKICEKKNKPFGCDLNECKKYALAYMKKEVSEDAGSKTD